MGITKTAEKLLNNKLVIGIILEEGNEIITKKKFKLKDIIKKIITS